MTSVGRYELVGPLAIGGMAEVLLARVRGPSGFERPVVIKRILPHIAREMEFREMFLDEARIAARIRHPNVVTVEELGEHADDLFIAMEYLEGESLSTLGKLQKKVGQRLPPHLGAHIVAQACAGLHAAHELLGPDGLPLGVVHRDISPQNVFLLYNGHVKVIDFGIAKARTSESRTRTGQVKGKFSYMSPEQCRAEPLDRRSDIFSLGILLYELTTGVRLFERPNDLLVFRAVCEEQMTRPSVVAPGYPPLLEQICIRALDRNPAGRYESAAAMRRDLLAVVRQLSPVEPEEELASLMSHLFVDRIGQKKRMLATLERGGAVLDVPAGEDSFRSDARPPYRPGTPPASAVGVSDVPTIALPVALPPPTAWRTPQNLSAPQGVAAQSALAPPVMIPPSSAVDENLPTKTNVAISDEKPAGLIPRRRRRWPLLVGALAILAAAAAIVPLGLQRWRAPTSSAEAAVASSSGAPAAEPRSATAPSTPTVVATADALVDALPDAPGSTSGEAAASPATSASAGAPAASPTARWRPPPKTTPNATSTATATSTGFRRFD